MTGWGVICLLLSLHLFQPICDAHPAQIAGALVQVKANGQVRVRVTFDLLAFVLNDTPQRIGDPPMNALLDGPAEELGKQLAQAKDRFERGFTMWADQEAVTIASMKFPSVKEVEEWKKSGVQPRLPVMLELKMEARLPAGTQTMAFQFPDVLGQIVVTLESPGVEARTIALEAGEKSRAMAIQLVQSRPSTMGTMPSPPPSPGVPGEGERGWGNPAPTEPSEGDSAYRRAVPTTASSFPPTSVPSRRRPRS